MTNREKQAFFNSVALVKAAAYRIKKAKLYGFSKPRCPICGCTYFAEDGSCRRCRGAITKQAVLSYYR